MAETGSLRTYLGNAPGAGKTFRMLAEGRSRAADGERVVIGWLETSGRAETDRLATDWRSSNRGCARGQDAGGSGTEQALTAYLERRDANVGG